jgi:hypothetical protein
MIDMSKLTFKDTRIDLTQAVQMAVSFGAVVE